MIERLPHPGFLAPQPERGAPGMVVNERTHLPCGCWAAVGIRVDTHEPALGASACAPEHHDLIEAFVDLYGSSLNAPTGRPAVEVADDILVAVARQRGVPT